MEYEESHLSDQDLTLAADGELAPARGNKLREHLAGCERCRERMNQFQAVLGDFVRLHRGDLDAQLPGPAGPRARLRARLAEAAGQPQVRAAGWFSLLFPRLARKGTFAAITAAVLMLVAISLRVVLDTQEAAAAPKPHLTPGATVPLTKEDVCRSSAFPQESVIPASLKQQVFQEYGIANPRPDAYEVDYLITPELGGATSIRNLWPQPYYNITWDARVKDQLEERLHSMVCSGEIDLATAQHDLATNWIAAYKKYFHTTRPLAGGGKVHANRSRGLTVHVAQQKRRYLNLRAAGAPRAAGPFSAGAS